MKRILFLMISVLFFILPPNFSSANANSPAADCKPVQQVFNKVSNDNGVCKVEVVRKELSVSYKGDKMSPEMMELAFSANFEKVGLQTVVMGEFALRQEEVNTVIDALRQGGLNVSALHNHMLFEDPRILFIHFQGKGDPVKLAQAVKYAITMAQAVKTN
jgi:hypothetical protein